MHSVCRDSEIVKCQAMVTGEHESVEDSWWEMMNWGNKQQEPGCFYRKKDDDE